MMSSLGTHKLAFDLNLSAQYFPDDLPAAAYWSGLGFAPHFRPNFSRLLFFCSVWLNPVLGVGCFLL
jgi:hypothetical protein